MLECNDVIRAVDVATLLKKSTSWCYKNASELGASKVRGSIIFRLSTLEQALEQAALKRESDVEKHAGRAGRDRRAATKKQVHCTSYSETDPSKYGLSDCMLAGRFRANWLEKSQDIFAEIDLQQSLKALRRY